MTLAATVVSMYALDAVATAAGLARATRVFLGLRSRRRDHTSRRTPRDAYASFDTDWTPKEYLADYYSDVQPDELQTIAFFVDAMDQVKPGEPVLFFGVGPTLHHVFLAADKASEIHLADYLPANLAEIERWVGRDPDAHDWGPFVRYTLQCEGHASPTEEQIREREEVTRAKITRLLEVDARRANPFEDGCERQYGTVISPYCADSATDDRAIWETFMGNIAGLVRPGGTFITSALRRCRGYMVGGKRFPGADVDEQDIQEVLRPRFRQDQSVEIRDLGGHEDQGYSGIVLAWARSCGTGAIVGGPQGTQGAAGAQGTQGAAGAQGLAGAQGPAGPQGARGERGPRGRRGRRGRPGRVIVQRTRVTGGGRQLRVSGVSTQRGRVAITLRRGRRVIGTGRRSVREGRRFTPPIRTRGTVRRGGYTLTTTLRPVNGRAWAGSERVVIR